MDFGSSMSVQEAHMLKSGRVSMGTTIMAVVFDGGVVMGADSRSSMGTLIFNRVANKITPITDFISCCRSGDASHTQAVANMVRYNLEMMTANAGGEQQTVRTASVLFDKIVYQNKDSLSAGILVAGWDKEEGGSVYTIPIGGGKHQADWMLAGSGSTYIYGHCDANYKKGMSEQETVKFVKESVALAIARDGSSGGCIRICVITKDGSRLFFVPGSDVPSLGNPGVQSTNLVSVEGVKTGDTVMAES